MKSLARTISVATALVVCLTPAFAQTPQVFTSGLLAPTKVIFTPRGNLIVAEQGNGPNTGRISIIDRGTGTARTLISGLPSGINQLGGEAAPSGPSGLDLQGTVLYVTIGSGDAGIRGPLPGTEIPSDAPSSPILSSLLAMDSRLPMDELTGGFTLTRAQHDELKSGRSVSFGSGFQQLTIRLIADFPDLRFEPRPDFPGNFRTSNPFGVAVRGDTAYVVDASWNLIHEVDRNSGAFQTLTTFPTLENNTGQGPPRVEAVPDSIQFSGGQLLVTTLSGFPFPPGAGRVFSVDPETGVISTRATGLTSAIDVEPIRDVTGGESFLVLEFSTNQLAGAPGRLGYVTGATGVVVAAPLITPTSMAADLVSGEVFITQIFTGQVVKVDASARLPESIPPSVIPLVAATTGVGGSHFETAVQLSNPYEFTISGSLILRTNGGANDPSIPYTLAPHATRNFENLMQSFGRTGLGSVDIVPTVGPPPIATVRVFETGSGNGFFQQPVPSANVLTPGDSVVLIAPSDLDEFRMNIGVRTFSAGASLRVTAHDSSGAVRTVASHTLAPNTITQMTASQFLGIDLHESDSITIEVSTGSAIVYGAVTNNNTQAASMQIPTPVQ
jgi:hypothetical protein